MTIDQINALFAEHFPQINFGEESFSIKKIEPMRAVVRLAVGDMHLRPGGTVSGPSMMELADLGAYVVVLAHIGPEPLAVTANLNINFLRKPKPGNLLGVCELIKLGQRLAIVDCAIKSEVNNEDVAKAVITYAIPIKVR